MYKQDLTLNNLQTYAIIPKQIIYIYYTYKQDLTLNNLQWLICHETQPNTIYLFYV